MTNRELNIVGRALTILQGFDKFYIKTPWWALLTVLGALYGAVFSYILATHISGAPANNNAVLDHSLFQLVAMFIIFVGLPKAIYTLGFRDFSPSRMLLKTIIFMVILFASGEGLLRIIYHDGLSFSHGGVLSHEFHKNAGRNKYDGPSRGPEINNTNTGGVHILIQGDSITWGQGVRQDKDIYTSVLLNMLKDSGLNTHVAAMAKKGREIDGHIEQIERWGPDIKPNVIIYQWHVTDIELDKRNNRPKKMKAPWKRLFFDRRLKKCSYFWFLLTYQLGFALPEPIISYAEYIEANYVKNIMNWQLFTDKFRRWYKLANVYTPNIIILIPSQPSNEIVDNKFINLALSLGAIVVSTADLTDGMISSRFDPHPNVQAHKVIAKELFDKITKNFSPNFTR